MKQIVPVTIWINGQELNAEFLNLTIVNDNLSTSATFYYQLFDSLDGVPTTQLASGNTVIDGTEYQIWGEASDVNNEAYVICANNLNLTLV